MEDLQSILEKINREGVEKADAQAAKIIAEARAKANAIIGDARAQAEKLKVEAEKSAADYAARAAETVAEGARDTLLKIEASVTAMLEKLLIKDVDTALSDESTMLTLIKSAIGELTGPGEITCGAKLASTLAAQAAQLNNFKVVTDETFGTGFTVKTDGGRVEHAFTGKVIATELARRLRPDLAKLLK